MAWSVGFRNHTCGAGREQDVEWMVKGQLRKGERKTIRGRKKSLVVHTKHWHVKIAVLTSGAKRTNPSNGWG